MDDKSNKWVMCGVAYAIHAFLNGTKKDENILIADATAGIVFHPSEWELQALQISMQSHDVFALVNDDYQYSCIVLCGLYSNVPIQDAIVSYVEDPKSKYPIYIINMKDNDIFPIETYALDELIGMEEDEDYFAIKRTPLQTIKADFITSGEINYDFSKFN